ncbi:hypothetical protein [Lentibacillus sp. JNUCC-1]|uniref:hypothetical protein n=1 Tax=Lentibacillus sp. JNUCC-1 TaxID=2654513 RepID=UPI0012E712C4|nr:hypothetical protein [Lentibacillus sp. JNUCC-1]
MAEIVYFYGKDRSKNGKRGSIQYLTSRSAVPNALGGFRRLRIGGKYILNLSNIMMSKQEYHPFLMPFHD